MDHRDQQAPTSFGAGGDALRADVAARIARIVGPKHADPDAIDVTTFLLEPPASPDDLARAAQRQRIVRIGSLVGCAILVVVLLVPLPKRSDSSAASPVEEVAVAARPDAELAPEVPAATQVTTTPAAAAPARLPRRVDTTTASRASTRRVDVAARPRPRMPARSTATTPTRVPTRPRPATTTAPVVAPATTPKPTPKPVQPRPAENDAEAVLVPLG